MRVRVYYKQIRKSEEIPLPRHLRTACQSRNPFVDAKSTRERTLDRSAAFRRSGSTYVERASLGEGDTEATPMLVEESSALLTKLMVGRVLLTEGSEKGQVPGQHTPVIEEVTVEEPDELRVQATGSGRNQRQKCFVLL